MLINAYSMERAQQFSVFTDLVRGVRGRETAIERPLGAAFERFRRGFGGVGRRVPAVGVGELINSTKS